MARQEFDFERGDRVLVRVRERGTSGRLQAKFEATVRNVYDGPATKKVSLNPPWNDIGGVTLGTTEAEVERLAADEEVRF